MKIWAKIAWRNVLRNYRRSFITVLAVTFGMASLTFLWGFINGAQKQMSVNLRQLVTGEAQIHAKGSSGVFNYNSLIENPQEILSRLSNIDEITSTVPRLFVGAMISSAEKSMGVIVIGIDPKNEAKFSLNKEQYVVRGDNVRADKNDMLMSQMIADQLGISIGDKAVLLAQDRYGSLVGQPFILRGIIETGTVVIDEKVVNVSLPILQGLLDRDGAVTKILLRVSEDQSLASVVERLEEILADQEVVVSTWEEAAPMLSQIISFQERLFFIVICIVLFVVAVGVLNTLVMSYVERIREFGLMKALGSRNRGVGSILFWEAMWLGLAGSLIGALAGGALVLYFRIEGLTVSNFSKGLSNLFIGNVVYPELNFGQVLVTIAVVMISNAVAAIYPAWRASKLEPIEAMQQTG